MTQPLVFDQEAVLARVDNDLELLAELVQIFESEYDTTIAGIKAAVSAGDSKSVSEKAHAIKSALGNLGAMVAHGLSFELEKAGKADKKAEFTTLVPKLEAAIAEFLKAYKAFAAK